MAASDGLQGMYDVTLKPRLLRSLLKEYVPDEKHPLANPSDLSYIVSALKTHQLLSERASSSTDEKVIDSWKSAVDAWINRVLSLVSSNMSDKSWAGICLLGLTFQECSTERFLASYSVWFNKILSNIQLPSDSHFVRVASCASLSDLFTRLGEVTNAKKDGTLHATKVVQPLLKLLNEDASDVVWEEAICLLCVVINNFPSSVGRHYDNVEAAIVSKIMSEKCNPSILEKLGHALASLPKSKGDDDSWSTMIMKILLSLNKQLDEVFQGLEEGSRRDEVMKLLLPPGKEPPPPLGGINGVSNQTLKRPEQFLVSRASLLLNCCCMMLGNSYPAQVPVPIRPLIAVARRVLMVDGSALGAYAFMTALRSELICSELPVLHSHSLDLLIAIVKGLRSQLLPHVADITRLLIEYFRTCALPNLRVKLYSLVKFLLMSMGVGIAMYMTQEILKNAFVDLDSPGHERSSCPDVAAVPQGLEEELKLPAKKKRKHSGTSGMAGEKSDQCGLQVERSHMSTPVAVKIAALEALEALLTVGGALRSHDWRPGVDHLLMTVASNACRGGWARERNTAYFSSDPPIWIEFQLASLRALLASLLSPGRVRPPHLAQGLDLFRRGSQNFGTKIAEYCMHALLALEVLIHPRALPLIDFQSVDHHYSSGTITGGFGHDSSFRSSMLGKRPSEPESNVDDLYESWLGNDEVEVPVTGQAKSAVSSGPPSGISRDYNSLEKVGNGLLLNSNDLEDNNPGPSTANATDLVHRDKMIVDSHTSEPRKELELDRQGDEHTAAGSQMMVLSSCTTTAKDLGAASGEGLLSAESQVTANATDMTGVLSSREDVPVNRDDGRDDGRDSILDTISAAISHTEQYAGVTDDMGDRSPVESLPDIVDGDPDSD